MAKRGNRVPIEDVWRTYHQAKARGDGEYHRNILLEHYRILARNYAERLHAKMPDKIMLDDLISAGIFGLMDAIDKYNPSLNVKFETYCNKRIRGSMIDELRKMDWVPRLVRKRANMLEKATKTLEINLGRKSYDNELRRELGLDKKWYKRLKKDANTRSLISIESTNKENDEELCVADTLQDLRTENPVLKTQKREIKSLLMKGLTREERLIVLLYYYEEMTMKEVGAVLDLSESRVSQLHSSIITRLKARIMPEDLYL